jgi:hypothetical protein
MRVAREAPAGGLNELQYACCRRLDESCSYAPFAKGNKRSALHSITRWANSVSTGSDRIAEARAIALRVHPEHLERWKGGEECRVRGTSPKGGVGWGGLWPARRDNRGRAQARGGGPGRKPGTLARGRWLGDARGAARTVEARAPTSSLTAARKRRRVVGVPRAPCARRPGNPGVVVVSESPRSEASRNVEVRGDDPARGGIRAKVGGGGAPG